MKTATTIDKAIRAGAPSFVTLLNTSLAAECVDYVNHHFVGPFMSKLQSERLPTHQRNLTDARTRIGGLLEYSFGLALQSMLEDQASGEYRISFVVTNRYPDLTIRDAASNIVIRIEMKALEVVSEEKSANFDAPVRDIHPGQDVLCVLVWGWQTTKLHGVTVDVPKVMKGFAFEAYPIARSRDLGWLSQRNISAMKGIDVVGPVVGKKDSTRWKEEEHNAGKLMRILNRQEVEVLPWDLKSHDSVNYYRAFKVYTISAGLLYNAERFIRALGLEGAAIGDFEHSDMDIQTVIQGRRASDGTEVIVAARPSRSTAKQTNAYERKLVSNGVADALIVIFNEKFSWSIYRFDGKTLQGVDAGRKFDPAVRQLKALAGT